jgi:Ser/Thr protein kinase RdoA (MazF antagonist)
MSEADFKLTPDSILDAIEAACPASRATGHTLALNSVENRVYQVGFEDGSFAVAKFYRAQRWTKEQILEEHAFIRALVEAEVPAVAPLPLSAGADLMGPTLARSRDGLYYAVFPKIRGRLLDELDDEKLRVLGRYFGRLHGVGLRHPRSTRPQLTPELWGLKSLDDLSRLGFFDSPSAERYEQVADALVERIQNGFAELPVQALHGDAHCGNVLWNEAGPFIVDFDDMLYGPPVQDIWMVVRGRDAEAERQRGVLLEAYREMQPFEEWTLGWIEALRALRMIHYSAWIARRWQDPSFPMLFPHFGSERWWNDETQALMEIEALMGG